MNSKRLWTGLASFAGMFILILDSKTALEGANEGIQLCIKTVIPSLFPFFVLSNLLTSSLMGLNFLVLKPIGKLFGLSKGTESLLIPAFLGGYPAGAQSISAACAAGQLSKESAARLLAFCNNAGPAFLFGMMGTLFPSNWYCWALWGIHIASAWLVSFLFHCSQTTGVFPCKHKTGIVQSVQSSLSVMVNVCGWIILFRVFLAFLDRWILWLFPKTVQVAIFGLLELSNGCCSLFSVESIPVRFLLASVLLAAGGLCVTMQTASVAKGISMRYYFLGKTIQVIFSILLSLALLQPWIFLPLLWIFIPFLTGKFIKNSRNPAAHGV